MTLTKCVTGEFQTLETNISQCCPKIRQPKQLLMKKNDLLSLTLVKDLLHLRRKSGLKASGTFENVAT